MPTISKADTIFPAATHLAQVQKGEILRNVRETDTEQLTRLVGTLQQTTTNEANQWAEQTSKIIPNINGQTGVDETPQNPTQKHLHSHTVNTINTQPKHNQKIVTSPK